jgi:hypothetical protein
MCLDHTLPNRLSWTGKVLVACAVQAKQGQHGTKHAFFFFYEKPNLARTRFKTCMQENQTRRLACSSFGKATQCQEETKHVLSFALSKIL